MTRTEIGEKVFAEGVVEHIKQYLPPEYGDVECEVVQQRKNNDVLKSGISFHKPGQRLGSVLYVEPYYQDVRQGKPIEEIMCSITEDIQKVIERTDFPEIPEVTEYDKVKELLSVKLVNTKANRQMLAEMPHKEIEDLSLIYILKLPMAGEEGVGSIKVSNELKKIWGISSEELHQTAMENAQVKEEAILQSIMGTIEGIAFEQERSDNNLLSKESIDTILKEPLYVLSNKEGSFGAAAITYPGVMDKISEMLPEGFYILPSSIHEVLIMPFIDETQAKYMGEMVRDVNKRIVGKSEVLSDRIYEYDKEHGKIRQVPESIERQRAMER